MIMPFIQVKSNVEIPSEKEVACKEALGKSISLLPGKSEQWLMVNIEGSQALYFQGKNDPAAYVEVKLYGGENKAAFDKFTSEVTKILSSLLGIKPNRIYVSYFTTTSWGYAGSNF